MQVPRQEELEVLEPLEANLRSTSLSPCDLGPVSSNLLRLFLEAQCSGLYVPSRSGSTR